MAEKKSKNSGVSEDKSEAVSMTERRGEKRKSSEPVSNVFINKSSTIENLIQGSKDVTVKNKKIIKNEKIVSKSKEKDEKVPDTKETFRKIKIERDGRWDENAKIVTGKKNYDGEVYSLEKIPRGKCLIINNMNFSNAETRVGSDKDVEALKNIFEKLHFEVDAKIDKKSEKIMQLLETYSKYDYQDYDALVIFIMSHGNEIGPLGTDEKPVKVRDMYEKFNAKNCKSLLGKPKMFFIQACRGEKDNLLVTDDFPQANVSDILLCFSTVEGYLSYREEGIGSVYVQKLRDCLIEFASSKDLIDILDEVDKRIRKYLVQFTKGQVTDTHKIGFNKKLFFNPNV